MTEQLDLFVESAKKDIVSEQDLQDQHDNKKKQNKLTPRQWRLHDLILYNSFVEHRKTTQKEICEKLKDWGYEYRETSGTNHDHCSMIWDDIKELNLSYETDKVIISHNFEYWIGDKEQTQEFMDELWRKLEPRLMRYWAFLKKLERNGQGQLLSRKLDPIDDNSKAREWIESYNNFKVDE